MKTKLVSFFFALCYSLSAFAYDAIIDGIYYNLNSIDLTAEVTANSYSGSVTIPETVTYSNTTYRVTKIGSWAFENCSGLTSVTIPNSVTWIGYHTFYGCSGLTSITIPNSVTTIGEGAFIGCSGLKKTNYTSTIADWCKIQFGDDDSNPMYYSHNLYINDVEVKDDLVIPEGVEAIGSYAFYYCDGLTSVTIPNSVTTIGDYAFSGCSGLTLVTLNSNAICSKGYDYSYNLNRIFGHQVKEYVIGNSVTTIGDWAFGSCSGLTSVTIPNSVTTIGSSAFSGCSGLTSVTIPNSVTTIGESAFHSCRGLTSVTIPNSVTEIGSSTFSSCSGLTSVTIPNSVKTIGNSAFSGCSGLTSITIPNSVTTIGGKAFYECKGLTSVTIGSSVKTIGEMAFYNCTKLTSVTIGNSVTTIGEKAFYNCTKLTSVTIGNSVTTIGDYAFSSCSGLKKTNYTGTIADWCKIKFGGYGNPMNYSHNFYINDVEVKDLVIPEGVESIRNYAFEGCSGLTSVTIPNSVKTIGEMAFYYCSSIADIYTYAITPPSAASYAFSGVSHHCYIHVPAGTIRAYQLALEWNEFYHFFEISEVPGGEGKVDVQVTENSAVFSWPVNPTASSYTLIIKKDDVVFCTLTFNSLGQLVGMAFAPTRNMPNATSAETTTYGYSFVVSNLDTNSTYDFVFTAKNASDEVLSEEVGHFTTTPTALPSTLMSTSVSGKILYNGHLYILRDGNLHTATGARVK